MDCQERKRLVEIQTKQLSDRLVTESVYLRESKNMTQQDIADMMGIPKGNVARIERRIYTPTIETLLKYAACLDMRLEFVLKKKE